MELQRLRLLTSKVVLRWIHQTLSRALEKWLHEVVRARKARKAALMWKNRAMGRALRRWIEYYSQVKRLRNLTLRVVMRWANGTLAKSMEKWWDEVVRARKAKKVALMWKNNTQGRAWRRWETMLLDLKRLRALAARAVARWKNRYLLCLLSDCICILYCGNVRSAPFLKWENTQVAVAGLGNLARGTHEAHRTQEPFPAYLATLAQQGAIDCL